MPEEANESFTVRDRRRFHLDEDTASADTPEAGQQTAPPSFAAPQDDPSTDFAEDNSLPDIYEVLSLFLAELRNLAWLRMGLVANPGTGRIERDMAQARIAIDSVVFLASQLENALPPEEHLPLRALVGDLQMNFIEQSKRG